jgi:hypothetical protein
MTTIGKEESVMGRMRFEFGSEQERDEFLVLNDLQLSGGGAIVDRERHVIGRLEDANNVAIREGSHHGLRTAEWWLSGEPSPPEPDPVELETDDEDTLAVIRSARTRLSALLRGRSRLQPEP